ncbi:MAG TPA: single-stranded-DNA-specific exonuclease RecJ [Bacteroidales bacterium]|nr:single-stranded-DNA-specific exonuclease RecJ [Bacteroidales bacterium]HOR08785.1 single-stranded-DNA-specific exonuclease RecJ [Bacteroidales bacterium]
MDKRWLLKERGDEHVVTTLATEMGVPVTVAGLMAQRGITTKQQAEEFFNPTLESLHDPFLMKDMNRAVDRIATAISRNEKILVYGDYDVDGTTSVAMLYSFLRERHSCLDYYIPDRYHEGYGLSSRGIDYAAGGGCKLIIALDCGIKAVEKVKYARSKGIDIIICDHHLPGEGIPDATAVLDPKQPGCGYPYKEMSGCGVGFKLMQAICMLQGIPFEEIIPYLDLVAVSIGSDIVPMTGENRILAYYGLKQLNESPRLGFQKIIEKAKIKKPLVIEDVVFRIGPRINAAGRMESGSRAVDLLVSQNSQEAMTICDAIDVNNDHRRKKDSEITAEALRMVSDDIRSGNARTTVLFHRGWHKGVIGIVASRLIETYYRPTVILTESKDGYATGSARSVPGYDLYQAIEYCSDLLESFGGHMFAAGLTLKQENLQEFRERFEQYVSETIRDEHLVPSVNIDEEIPLEEVTMEFCRHLEKFQPFGPENTAPVFVSRRVKTLSCQSVGANGIHLKLSFARENGEPVGAIAFGQADMIETFRESGGVVDIAYSVEMNEFRGKRSVQLNIKDIKG